MLFLMMIGGGGLSDIPLQYGLTDGDKTIALFAVIALIYSYIKVRKRRKKGGNSTFYIGSPINLDATDVLMQPIQGPYFPERE